MDTELILAIVGVSSFLLGILIAFLWGRSALSRERERGANLFRQLEQRGSELEESRAKYATAERSLATLGADYRNLEQRLEEKKGEMANLQERFTKEFENLANRILEEKSRKFTEQNREKIEGLLKPLGSKIEEFRKQVQSSHRDTVEGHGALREHLKLLQQHNSRISEDAQNLTRALKGDAQKQGAWGEIVLERVLEMSGLRKGIEYEVQESHTREDGGRARPDAVVKLPDGKRLVIDSKVSLTAYERFVNAADDSAREQALAEHRASVRHHVKDLGEKNYQQLYGGASPDFVILFIPIEPAFGLAAGHDPGLYAEAFDRGIVMVSPSTLLATLKTIESIWKREHQNKNALEIADRGGKLYDKFHGFVESLEDIGERLNQAQASYDQAMNRLSTGRGNLVRQVEDLKQLGAKASKQLPENLLDDGAGLPGPDKGERRTGGNFGEGET